MEPANEGVPDLYGTDGASPPFSVNRLALANIPTAHCEWMMLPLVGSRNNSIFFPLLSVT